MKSWDTFLLLRCLAKTDMVTASGYFSINFEGWLTLDGIYDPSVFQMLANAASNATVFVFDQQSSLGTVSGLSSDMQFQLASFSTYMLNTADTLTHITIKDLP